MNTNCMTLTRFFLEGQKKHKDAISEKKKIYVKEHKEEISLKTKGKILCECGCIVNKYNLNQHKQTQKHKDLMETKLA